MIKSQLLLSKPLYVNKQMDAKFSFLLSLCWLLIMHSVLRPSKHFPWIQCKKSYVMPVYSIYFVINFAS